MNHDSGLLSCSECKAGLVQPTLILLTAYLMAERGQWQESSVSRAVRPVCSSDMAALIARAKSQQGAECIWDVMHDCLPSLHGIMISAQLYTCAGPSCATPPICPSEALAAQLTLAATWAVWGPATAPAQVRQKVQPAWPPRAPSFRPLNLCLTVSAPAPCCGACWVKRLQGSAGH